MLKNGRCGVFRARTDPASNDPRLGGQQNGFSYPANSVADKKISKTNFVSRGLLRKSNFYFVTIFTMDIFTKIDFAASNSLSLFLSLLYISGHTFYLFNLSFSLSLSFFLTLSLFILVSLYVSFSICLFHILIVHSVFLSDSFTPSF